MAASAIDVFREFVKYSLIWLYARMTMFSSQYWVHTFCNLPHIRNPSLKSMFVKIKGFVISTLYQHTIGQVSESIIVMQWSDMVFNTSVHPIPCNYLLKVLTPRIDLKYHRQSYLSVQYLSKLTPHPPTPPDYVKIGSATAQNKCVAVLGGKCPNVFSLLFMTYIECLGLEHRCE